MESRRAFIALNMMEGMGPVRVRALTEALGSVAAIFTADEKTLQRARGIGPDLAARTVRNRDVVDVEAELEKAASLNIRIITSLDPEYPALLKEMHDPPLAVYVRGRIEESDRSAIGIVGSRRASHYGLNTTDRLSYQLVKVGYTIVSGLARGIDTAAHEGALKAKGRTIAVIGSAHDELYPPENKELAERIAGQGAVISEFPFGRKADKSTFPMRNRIVSALSSGVVVVESGVKGGAMITADLAAEQGIPVFAVPGRIDTPMARGPHKLIKEGARLVEDVQDILNEFEMALPKSLEAKKESLNEPMVPQVELSDEEQAIVRELWHGEKSVDVLARELGLPVARINVLLMGLEMKRVVRALPGRVIELAVEMRREE